MRKKATLVGLPLLAVAAISSSLNSPTRQQRIELSLPESPLVQFSSAEHTVEVVKVGHPDYEYEIKPGDNLSTIFNQLGFAYTELMKVMETDLNYLALLIRYGRVTCCVFGKAAITPWPKWSWSLASLTAPFIRV